MHQLGDLGREPAVRNLGPLDRQLGQRTLSWLLRSQLPQRICGLIAFVGQFLPASVGIDILTRPEPRLTNAEELEVKKVARRLLDKLKREKFVLDWRLKESAKADVRETIRQEYDLLPAIYVPELWDEKVERTYRFAFEHFGAAPVA